MRVDPRLEPLAALRNLSSEVVYFASKTTTNAFWESLRGYAFVISPWGNGLDCHRTWEALQMRSVPIVRSGHLEQMYLDHNLPVMVVQSWSDVNETSLREWSTRMATAL